MSESVSDGSSEEGVGVPRLRFEEEPLSLFLPMASLLEGKWRSELAQIDFRQMRLSSENASGGASRVRAKKRIGGATRLCLGGPVSKPFGRSALRAFLLLLGSL